MIKQLGWISVAALSLAALSACEGGDKTAPAPTGESTKVATPEAVGAIHVDPVAVRRLETMYGDRLAETLGGPALAKPRRTTASWLRLQSTKRA